MADKGVSVQEIEQFTKKYLNEIFFIVSLVVAMISSMLDFFTGPSWTIGCTALFAILSISYPQKVGMIEKKVFHFLDKQDRAIQITLGAVRLVLAIFVPFVLFAELGLLAGLAFHILPKIPKEGEKNLFKEQKPSSGEGEHL